MPSRRAESNEEQPESPSSPNVGESKPTVRKLKAQLKELEEQAAVEREEHKQKIEALQAQLWAGSGGGDWLDDDRLMSANAEELLVEVQRLTRDRAAQMKRAEKAEKQVNIAEEELGLAQKALETMSAEKDRVARELADAQEMLRQAEHAKSLCQAELEEASRWTQKQNVLSRIHRARARTDHEQLQGKEEELENLRDLKENLQSQCVANEERVADLEREARQKENELGDLRADVELTVSQREEQVRQARSEKEELQSKIEELRRIYEERQQEEEHRRASVMDMSSVHSLQSELDVRVMSLKNAIEDEKMENKKLLQENGKQAELFQKEELKVAEKQKEVDHLRRECENFKSGSKLQGAQLKARDADTNKIKANLAEVLHQKENAIQQNVLLAEKYYDVEQQLEKRCREMQEFRLEKESLATANALQTQRLEHLEEQCEKIQERARSEAQARVDELQAKSVALERAAKELKKTNAEQAQRLEDAFRQLNEATKKCSQLRKEAMTIKVVNALRREAQVRHQKSEAELNAQILAMRTKVEENEARQSEIDAMVVERAHLHNTLSAAQTKLRTLEEANEKLSQELEAQIVFQSDSSQQLEASRVQLSLLEGLQDQLAQLQEEHECLSLQHTSLETDYDSMRLQEEAAQQQLTKLEQHLIHNDQASIQSPNLAAMQTKEFTPNVAVFDCPDKAMGVVRMIRIEVPGRHFDYHGKPSISGTVQPLANGVYVKLSKEAEIPSTAQMVPPFHCSDIIGSWEWKYEPSDGIWGIIKSWGLSHGVLGLALAKVPDGALYTVGEETKNDFATSAPSPQAKGPRKKAVKRSTQTASEKLPPISTHFAVVAVSGDAGCATLLRDTVLTCEDGSLVQAVDLAMGMRLCGPSGYAVVRSVKPMTKQEHKVLTVYIGLEALTVLADQPAFAGTVTEDGAATSDWSRLPVCELRAGMHELAVYSAGGLEEGALITAVKRSMRSTAILQVELAGSDDVFVCLCLGVPKKISMTLARRYQATCQKTESTSLSQFAPQKNSRSSTWH